MLTNLSIRDFVIVDEKIGEYFETLVASRFSMKTV